MIRKGWSAPAVALTLTMGWMSGCSSSPEAAYHTGNYRNLFLEAGYTQEAIDQKVEQAYHDLFEGPDRIYFEVGDSMAYVSDIKNKDVRTEGVSYGMMVAVQFDKRSEERR